MPKLPLLLSILALAAALPATASATTAERTGDIIVLDAAGVTVDRAHQYLRVDVYTRHLDDPGVGESSDRAFLEASDGPLRASPGCVAERGGVTCDSVGAAAIRVLGPRAASLLLSSNSSSSGTVPMHVRAGALSDRLDLHNHVADVVESCGAGYDAVDAEPRDVVAADCEEVTGGPTRAGDAATGAIAAARGIAAQGALSALRIDGDVAVGGGNDGQAALVRVRCPADAASGCAGRASATFVRGARACFGGAPYAVAAGTTRWVIVDAGPGCGVRAQGSTRRRFLREAGRLPMPVEVALEVAGHRTSRVVVLMRRVAIRDSARVRLGRP